MESVTNKIVGTLPALSGVPDKAVIKFISYTGLQINGTIQAPGSDTILYGNTTTQKLYLGMNETITLMKKTSAWYVIDEKSDANEVGRVLFADKVLANTVKAEGQLLNRLEYPRLWAFANTLGALLLTDAARTADIAHSGFFSSGDGSTTFRLPDLRGVFLRGLDGSRGLDADRVAAGQNNTPGFYEKDTAGQHSHGGVSAESATHSSASSAGSGLQGLLVSNTLPVNDFLIKLFDSGDVYDDAGLATLTTESRGKNVAKYALIKY
jgi:microcystin-dependent protein